MLYLVLGNDALFVLFVCTYVLVWGEEWDVFFMKEAYEQPPTCSRGYLTTVRH